MLKKNKKKKIGKNDIASGKNSTEWMSGGTMVNDDVTVVIYNR